jgi:hypothetical protein
VPDLLQISLVDTAALFFSLPAFGKADYSSSDSGGIMPRLAIPLLLLLLFLAPAHAVIKGSASSHAGYTVRLLGKGTYCSGVIVARDAIITAAHCARTIPVVGGRSLHVAGIARSAVLDDGRHVNVSGDAVILRLASPLATEIAAAPIGEGTGDSYTIVGYGTTDERSRKAFAPPYEATLVPQSPGALVDPNRTGSLGASACFGDSGGPVLRGGKLVGIITRASHPSPHLVCGHLTHWAPVTASHSTLASGDSITSQRTAAEQPR